MRRAGPKPRLLIPAERSAMEAKWAARMEHPAIRQARADATTYDTMMLGKLILLQDIELAEVADLNEWAVPLHTRIRIDALNAAIDSHRCRNTASRCCNS